MPELPDFSGSSILVVDDDATFRSRVVRAFTDRGLDARSACDYESAMQEAVRESPELALIDLRMPGRSGLELLRDLKAFDPLIHVIVFTGYGSIANALEAVHLGATHYLTKPADTTEILQAFARAIRPPELELAVNESVPSLARVEWEHIQRIVSDCGGNISQAARLLGIHRRSLQRKLSKYPARR